jgi:uncharacterized LabA/DUF88 family protein
MVRTSPYAGQLLLLIVALCLPKVRSIKRTYSCGCLAFQQLTCWLSQRKATSSKRYAIRAHYYTSLVGDEPRLNDVKKAVRLLGFQPHVFEKLSQEKKAKGVDITLTKDLLVNAFQDNYDVAVLMAGDGDYVPVVEELKRMGKTVYVVFFTEDCAGLNDNLRWASDKFFTLSETFKKAWTTTQSASAKAPRAAKPESEE